MKNPTIRLDRSIGPIYRQSLRYTHATVSRSEFQLISALLGLILALTHLFRFID